MNPSETARKGSKEHTRNARRGLAGVAAGTVLIGGLVVAEGAHENSVRHEQRVEALEKADTPIFRTVALPGGTQLRITPKIEAVSASSGDVANLAGEIPKDEVWVAVAPLVNLENPQWIAITKPGEEKDIHSIDDRADKTVWVHYGPDLIPGKGGVPDWELKDNGATEVNGVVSSVIESTFSVDANSLDVVQGLVEHE